MKYIIRENQEVEIFPANQKLSFEKYLSRQLFIVFSSAILFWLLTIIIIYYIIDVKIAIWELAPLFIFYLIPSALILLKKSETTASIKINPNKKYVEFEIFQGFKRKYRRFSNENITKIKVEIAPLMDRTISKEGLRGHEITSEKFYVIKMYVKSGEVFLLYGGYAEDIPEIAEAIRNGLDLSENQIELLPSRLTKSKELSFKPLTMNWQEYPKNIVFIIALVGIITIFSLFLLIPLLKGQISGLNEIGLRLIGVAITSVAIYVITVRSVKQVSLEVSEPNTVVFHYNDEKIIIKDDKNCLIRLVKGDFRYYIDFFTPEFGRKIIPIDTKQRGERILEILERELPNAKIMPI